MKLVVIRHGETTANVARLFSGHQDVELTDKGREQAKEVSEKLKDYNFTKIYSSDLVRARNTAEIINKYHNKQIIVSNQLREMNFGEYEGTNYDEAFKLKTGEVKKGSIGTWDFRFKNGENLEEMKNRVMGYIDKIKEDANEDDTILVVAHGGVIRMILAMEVACNKESYWRFDACNCGITELKYHKDFCFITKFNG